MAKKYVQCNNFFLAGSGVIIGATSITLTNLTDIYGNILTMADFGDTGYITLEPDTNNEEAATFTGIVANANLTYTLTGVKTALAKSPYTETSGLVRQHSGGTKVVVTDSVAFWNTFGNKANDETLTGRWGTAVVPSAGNDLANKTYVDGVAIAGSPDASTITKGISKMSVAPASATNPIAVGDNDPRLVTSGQSPIQTNDGNPYFGTSLTNYADIVNTSASSLAELGEANSTGKKNKLAQSFKPTVNYIFGVLVTPDTNVGTFVGTVTVALQANSAGVPSGTDLVSVTMTNADWIANYGGYFMFPNIISVTAGTTYWIVISTSTADNSNHPQISTNTGAYSEGAGFYWNTTDGWVALGAGIDLSFATFKLGKFITVNANGRGNVLTPIANREIANKEYADSTAAIAAAAVATKIVLLKAESGSSTNASANNASSVAITGLTANDTILIHYSLEYVGGTGGATANASIYDVTDSKDLVSVDVVSSLLTGESMGGTVTIRQLQTASTSYEAINLALKTTSTSENQALRTTSNTAWTGSWTLAFRIGGISSMTSIRWSWSVHKILGQ